MIGASVVPLLLLASSVANALAPHHVSGNRQYSGWSLQKMTTLVNFGDSYSDECRAGYYLSHNNTGPPPGTVFPACNQTAVGGYVWPRIVANATGANTYNYAVSGATCSNKINPTYSGNGTLTPSVAQAQVPACLADMKAKNSTTKKLAMSFPSKSTVYAVWVGTNELGPNQFLTDSVNATIPDAVSCVFDSLKQLYKAGARYFVIFAQAPLQLAPQYATLETGGVAKAQYWPTKPDNATEVSYRMRQQVDTMNAIYTYRTPYEVALTKRFPDAEFAFFDVNRLMKDIYANGTKYLQAPANVTGYVKHCYGDGNTCEYANNTESFMWHDQLHPSAMTTKIIAGEFQAVVNGTSKYAEYHTSSLTAQA